MLKTAPPKAALPRSRTFLPLRSGAVVVLLSIPFFLPGLPLIAQDEGASDRHSDDLLFFEDTIRPLLLNHCLDCHSLESEASGGLVLDSKDGWLAGGDSGTSIIPGNAEQSLVFRAISYADPNLQMPPDERLPADAIRAIRTWIERGAADPRRGQIQKKQSGLSVERAWEHWAYRPLTKPEVPRLEVNQGRWLDANPIDRFLDAKLRQEEIAPLPGAANPVWARRLHHDLTGLPPSPGQLVQYQRPIAPDSADRLIDRLLASPRFGEHFARQWMDVARYAESITLRGFILPNAWRFRDYCIESFAQDRPFDQMIHEQLAGDLLDAEERLERNRQLVATTFLAMGNTNLEQQDKAQLEMDYIDEQLELVGRAFLGQTIGCARCHDHKFDPIPTQDYYALAGIFHSAVALKHDNVSKWIERPLPLNDDEQARYDSMQKRLLEIESDLDAYGDQRKKQSDLNRIQKLEDLPGIVVDNQDAKKVGTWIASNFLRTYVGEGYLHDGNQGRGQKTVTFEPTNLPPGRYQVRLAYSPGGNRASNTRVHVFSAEGEKLIEVDQTREPSIDGLWMSLGIYRFEENGQAYVLISNKNANGHVIADAVQFLREDALLDTSLDAPGQPKNPTVERSKSDVRRQRDADWLKALEKEKGRLKRELKERPMYLTVTEKRSPVDLRVHIRGDVHNLGELAPRGFLTLVRSRSEDSSQQLAKAKNRLELARWITSRDNPLAARVYANRVWLWLMGRGLVSTPNNFGTTGQRPSHPELLDWLACELIQSGWSTKHLVRIIVQSNAYRRKSIPPPQHPGLKKDPENRLYWRGTGRKLSAETLRDSMLMASGELDLAMGGTLLQSGIAADYDYRHSSTRRSIYQPVLRNSLPDLFEAFDFADSSVSTGQRPRSTVATQSLVLMNHPWVISRAQSAAIRLHSRLDADHESSFRAAVEQLYLQLFGRLASEDEAEICHAFLMQARDDSDRLLRQCERLVHTLFASIDFRYLD